MTEHVSSLAQLMLRGSRFLVIVVNESGQSTVIQRALDSSVELFGDEVGLAARLVRATPHSRVTVAHDLFKKNWPADLRDRMQREATPYVIFVSDVDFDEFNPQQHDWRILWLESAQTPRNSIPNFFGILQQAIARGETPFDLLDQIGDAQTGASVYGSVTTPERLQPAGLRRGTGRPGILDPGHGVKAWIEEEWQRGNLRDRSGGWMARLVDQLMQAKPNLPGKPKSIKDRLRKEGIFDDLKARD